MNVCALRAFECAEVEAHACRRDVGSDRSAMNPINGLPCIDMLAVDVAAGRIMAVEGGPARTAHHGAWLLRGQLLAAFPQRIFLGGLIALVSPLLEIDFRQPWQNRPPGGFKTGAAVCEVDSGAVPVPLRFHAGIEAAFPFPLIDVRRAAHAPRDRTDMDIAVIGVPAVLAFGIAVAGEGGHRP
jgi:hypothetical protein